jgi:hypothetical protein
MKSILLSYFLLGTLVLNAQHHSYSYDASGNRIKREYEVLSLPGGSRLAAPSDSMKATPQAVVKAYPNPFTDQLTIELSSENDSEVIERMQLFDMKGRIITDLTLNQKQKTLDTDNLANGKYIIKLYRRKENNGSLEPEQYLLIKQD